MHRCMYRPMVPQMTTMLDLLSSYLEQREVGHCRIDGSICWQVRWAAGAGQDLLAGPCSLLVMAGSLLRWLAMPGGRAGPLQLLLRRVPQRPALRFLSSFPCTACRTARRT